MQKLNAMKFGFDFFLTGRKEVKDLHQSAIENGGATFITETNFMYSNYEKDNFIHLKEKENKLSIFIPSTVDVNTEINSEPYVRLVKDILVKEYGNVKQLQAVGTWYDEEAEEVVEEKITILEIVKDTVSDIDLYFFKNIGKHIKEVMTQQAVTININEAMALV